MFSCDMIEIKYAKEWYKGKSSLINIKRSKKKEQCEPFML